MSAPEQPDWRHAMKVVTIFILVGVALMAINHFIFLEDWLPD
jgi:hypothetical protein